MFSQDDENKSFEERLIDEDDEERVVAEFVSEIELHNDSVKLRRAPGAS